MKVFNHVFNTWILAQVLHPVIFFTYFSVFLNDPVVPATQGKNAGKHPGAFPGTIKDEPYLA